MNAKTVNLTGQEYVPLFIKSLFGPNYKAEKQLLTSRSNGDCYEYQYRVTMSPAPAIMPKTGTDFGEVADLSARNGTTKSNLSDENETDISSISNTSLAFAALRKKPSLCPAGFRCITMIQVKFVLLYTDTNGHNVQSTFAEEIQSNRTVEETVLYFQNICKEKMNTSEFRPRISYCINRAIKSNSFPLLGKDLKKTIEELADGQPINRLILIADAENN